MDRGEAFGGRRAFHALAALLAILILSGCLVGCDAENTQAKSDFKAAVDQLEQKTAALDDAIASLQEILASGEKPLDPLTISNADEAISTAQAARTEAPEMARDTQDILVQVESVNSVDYSAAISSLEAAQSGLENSIKQMEQLTNPSGSFIVQRLTGVDHIETPTAVTEERDPNGLLNKQGGYTATVYFMSDLVSQDDIQLDKEVNELLGEGSDVIGLGTSGGGAVEVYATEEEANFRDRYLGAFDGSLTASGSHHVYGTCIIRTSDHLTASQQQELEGLVLEALARLE